jgi:hypothetical protein
MARLALPPWLALALLLVGCTSPSSKRSDATPPAPVPAPADTATAPVCQPDAPPGGGLDAPTWSDRHPRMVFVIGVAGGVVVAVFGVAELVAYFLARR